MRASARAKKLDMTKFRQSAEQVYLAELAAAQEEVLEAVVEDVMGSLEEIKKDWSGGEDYKAEEQRILRKRGLTKLANKRSERPTYPNLDFAVDFEKVDDGLAAKISTDNPLFAWLDRGTKGMTPTAPTKIVPIGAHGTFPGQRQVTAPVAAGNVVRLQAGKAISGIKERSWTKDISKEVGGRWSSASDGFTVKVEVL